MQGLLAVVVVVLLLLQVKPRELDRVVALEPWLELLLARVLEHLAVFALPL